MQAGYKKKLPASYVRDLNICESVVRVWGSPKLVPFGFLGTAILKNYNYLGSSLGN